MLRESTFMFKLYYLLAVVCLLLSFSSTSHATDLLQYANSLQVDKIDPASTITLTGLIESCGNNNQKFNDLCMIEGLQYAAKNERYPIARSILQTYMKILSEGKVDILEKCHHETHLEANKVVGHCFLLMSYHALKTQNPYTAKKEYELCLQGSLQALLYNGNIVAQYLLSKLYGENGLEKSATAWNKGLSLRENTKEYRLLKECYE